MGRFPALSQQQWSEDETPKSIITLKGTAVNQEPIESATLELGRRQNVVTVVYTGCHHRYTFAGKRLETCVWETCRMVEVPHRQHHMDLHNRLEMGCAERRSMFSLKTFLRSGGWDNANQMNTSTKTAAPVHQNSEQIHSSIEFLDDMQQNIN